MKTSDQGRHLLLLREGKRNMAYQDTVGVWTIGVGHTGPEVHAGLVWTDEQVDEAFAQDLARFEAAVDAVHHALVEYQYDALVSFSFNVGINAFKQSTMVRLLNDGKIDEVPAQFDRWHIPLSIISRRNGEREQFKGTAFEPTIP